MKRHLSRLISFLLCSFLCIAALNTLHGKAVAAPDDAPFDGYIVKVSGQAIMAMSAADDDAQYIGGGLYLVDSPEDAKTLPGMVEYIEPNYILYELDEPITGYTSPQWSGAAVKFEAAWSVGLFGNGVKVALVDSGLFAAHEDITETNILQIVDFTGDGRTIADASGHGTAVGGLLAAKVNNVQSAGTPAVDGGAPGVTILPLRVFSQDKSSTVSMAIEAINYAVDQGCDVINLSVGTTAFSLAFRNTCDAAANSGVLLVAAAGNWGNSDYGYPASFDSVVSVAAVMRDGMSGYTRPAFSQQNDKVFVTAPGSNMTSLGYASSNSYITGREGTSYSAPIVSAMAAIAKEQNKAVTPETFKKLLMETSVDLGAPGRDNAYGWGLVNMERFVNEITREYTISYVNADGLSGWPMDDTYKLSMGEPLTLPTPSRPAYDFAGWYESSDFSGPRVSVIVPGMAGDMTLYAKWEIKEVFGVGALTVAGIAAITESNSEFSATVPKNFIISASDIEITAFLESAVVENLAYVPAGNYWKFTIRSTGGSAADFKLTVIESLKNAPELKQSSSVAGAASAESMDGFIAASPLILDLSEYFNDPEGGELIYHIIPGTAAGLPVINGSALAYTPTSGDAGGVVNFRVVANNGYFASRPLTVSVVVDRQPSRSAPGTDSVIFDCYIPEEIKIPMTLYDNTLDSVLLSEAVLVPGSDYSQKYHAIDGEDAIVINTSFLSRLSVGNYTLTFLFSAGDPRTMMLIVIDTRPGDNGGGGNLGGGNPGGGNPGGGNPGGGNLGGGNPGGGNPGGVNPSGGNPGGGNSNGNDGDENGGSSTDPSDGADSSDEDPSVNELIEELGTTDPPYWENPFGDIKTSDWFYEDVEYVFEKNLMLGTSSDPMLFNPGMTISRAMVVTILYRYEGSMFGGEGSEDAGNGAPADNSGFRVPGSGFSDVADGLWYSDAVWWASENAIVTGYGNGVFGPNDPITRQDFAVILMRYAEYSGMTFPVTRVYSGFIDDKDIADYAKEAVERFFVAGVINGYPDGSFNSVGSTTRAEAAAMMRRFFEGQL